MLSNHISTQYGACVKLQRTYVLLAKDPKADTSTADSAEFALNANNNSNVNSNVSKAKKYVTVQLDYCMCVVTRQPFLTLLFHILQQFDAMGGLDVNAGKSISDLGYVCIILSSIILCDTTSIAYNTTQHTDI